MKIQLCALLLAFGVAGAAPAQEPAPRSAAAPDADAPIPVEAFAALPVMENPQLSPDGTRIVAKMAIGGVQRLVVVLLHTSAGKPAVMGVGETVDVNWWRWVGNDWLAVGVGTQSALYGTDIYVTRTIGVNAAMTKVNRIDWPGSGVRADDLLWAARDGSPRILLARQTGVDSLEQFYPEVIDVDLSTGRTHRILPGRADVYDWFTDGAGQVRMGYRYDDATRRGALLYRADNRSQFREIATRKRGDERGIPAPLIFRADGTAIATDDSAGYDAVYEVSLPDLTLGKRVFGADGYDVDDVVPNAAKDDLAGIRLTERYDRTAWLDPALKQIQEAADKAVGERRAQIVSWNADRTQLLIAVGAPSQAGAIYYWNTAADRMQRLVWTSDTLKARMLSPVKTIRYAARDGTKIEAVLTMPRHRLGQKNLPVIVLPHGGPFARDAEGWDWWVQYLAELGYVVIQPNYRGSSGYGTAFAKLAEGEWGLKMQDDLNDALAWAAKEGIADPKRACMIGASYGGYAAMRAAQRDGALYRCAVSYAGVSDLAALREYDSQFLNGGTRGAWLRQQAPDFKAVSPRFGAASFSIPILIVHGKEDKRVPVRQSRILAAALKEAGKPYEYIEQPLGDHHFSRAEDRLDFLTRMRAFLDRYNPA